MLLLLLLTLKMTLKFRTFFLYVSISILPFAALYRLLLPTASIYSDQLRRRSPQLYIPNPRLPPYNYIHINQINQQQQQQPISINNNYSLPSYDDDRYRLTQVQSSDSVQFSNSSTGSVINRVIQSNPRGSHVDRTIPVEIERNVVYDTTNTTNTTRVNDDSASLIRKADSPITNVSVLFPAWEALVIVSSENGDDDRNYASFYCLFDTNEISPARFSGTLSNPERKAFTCQLPKRFLRRLPFRQPVLTMSPEQIQLTHNPLLSPVPELLRWNFIVYDVVETETDVVLLAKGINNRQGINRSPTEFKCLFGDDTVHGVTTSVTSSVQEVFRCQRPDLTALSQRQLRVKVSLLILQTNQVVPSIAYYTPVTPQRTLAKPGTKSLLCACTMVYNVAKFLKEWVIYHSKIGVDKFILYDNNSDDNLSEVVSFLISKGFNIETHFWLWPKTQEAGFSHSTLLAKNTCQWMMFIDVDEFIYSPSWAIPTSKPSKSLLQSLLPANPANPGNPIGQLVIRCFEFGPSRQKTHPLAGVTQGYTCRKEVENRHKSIVLVDAVHESLANVVHHFKLKDGYKSKKVKLDMLVVNHYKYQAWPEFKAKFRRRVSAYVVDWTRSVNMRSNDRAPGLGYLAVEPEGWEERFCEVYDDRLKRLTRRWFGTRSGFRMIWQDR